MRVTDGNREGIGGITARNFHARKQVRDHGVNLCFLRIANADNRLLNEPSGIFADDQARFRRAEQNHPARLAKLKRRLRIGVDEHFLNRGGLWLMFKHHISQRPVKRDQPFSQWHFRISADLAIGDVAEPIANRCDDAPAGRAKPRIEAEDDQGWFTRRRGSAEKPGKNISTLLGAFAPLREQDFLSRKGAKALRRNEERLQITLRVSAPPRESIILTIP